MAATRKLLSGKQVVIVLLLAGVLQVVFWSVMRTSSFVQPSEQSIRESTEETRREHEE